jgi:DNA-binding NtrC family response regulator
MARHSAQPARRWRLHGQVEGRALVAVLALGENVVGSLPECDVYVPHPTVSRRHAVVRVNGSSTALADLGSKNGTYVNGVRISEAELQVGDKIQFGAVTFVAEVVEEDDVELAIPLDRRSAARPQPVEQPITQSGDGDTGAAGWLRFLLRIGDLVLEASAPDLEAALHELQRATGAGSVLLVEWSGIGEPRVIQVLGDGSCLYKIESARGAFALMHEVGTKKRARRSFEIPGDEPFVLAVSTAPGRPTLGLAVIGTSSLNVWSTLLAEIVLQLITHSHSERRSSPPRGRAHQGRELTFPEGYVVGRSGAMQALYAQMAQFADGDLPVLITGETGAGKEHIARTLHASSPRRQGPFQAINCAAVPAGLLEAELFGVERGAATGVTERPGQFQLARGGVLFLDEIGELPPELQAKLLRVLQLMEVHAVGARRPVRVDVRIVAATNTRPEELLATNRLRRDLYYRIAGCTFHVPPLRERREDIPPLVEHFVRHHANECGKRILGVSVRALRTMVEALWPGNVRELENEVRRLVYLCPEGMAIEAGMLSGRAATAVHPLADERALAAASDLRIQPRIDYIERALITAALRRTDGNRSRAADLLGVTRDGLRMKMVRLGLTPVRADTPRASGPLNPEVAPSDGENELDPVSA